IDEPRGPDVTCFCSVCRALCPDVTDLQRFRMRSMVDFLGELCGCVKRVDPYAKTAIALLPQDLGQADELAALPHLDTVGGHLFWQLLHEDVAVVEKTGRSIEQRVRRYSNRRELCLQNIALDSVEEHVLESRFKQIEGLETDEVAVYYYRRFKVDL